MALDGPNPLLKPAIRVITAGACSAFAGPLGALTGAFIGGILGHILGEGAGALGRSAIESLVGRASETFLDSSIGNLAERLRKSRPSLEGIYREALRRSLSQIKGYAGTEYSDWFDNWNTCLQADVQLSLDEVQPSQLTPDKFDALFRNALERIDAQGTMITTHSSSILLLCRPAPEPLLVLIKNRLPNLFADNFRALIVQREQTEAWNEAQLAFQDCVGASLIRIEQQLVLLKQTVDDDFHKVLRVIDPAFIEKQNEGEVTRFLSISRGDWKLVAQRGGIERDLAQEVTLKLLQSHDGRAVLQPISGEPGSGKTTLLLQIGVRLVEAGCTVVEVIGKLDDFRYYVTKLSKMTPGRLFILIDDIYKDESEAPLIVDVLSSLGESLPITIVATTPSFANRTKYIRTSSYLEILPGVSPDVLSDHEIGRLREMPSAARLSKKQFTKLSQSRRILVVMLQLTEGKPIDEILLGTARRLKLSFPDTYRAWGIVVDFNAYGLHVPSSLLELVLGIPYFCDSIRTAPAKIGSEGIIFPSSNPYFKESWSAGHILIADHAFKVEFADTLRRTCMAAVQTASPSDPEHSIFLGRMLRSLTTGTSNLPAQMSLAAELFSANREKVHQIAHAHPGAMPEWGVAFCNLGQNELAVQCFLNAKPTTPNSALDIVSGLEQLGKARQAVDAAIAWCDSHPDDTYVRTLYLGLVKRQADRLREPHKTGKLTEAQRAIDQTGKWLDRQIHNPAVVADDASVRTSYLDLVESKGTTAELKDAIAQTREWLARNPDDHSVRSFYLGLVERRAKRSLGDAIEDTIRWLKDHPGAAGVWTALIAAVIRNRQVDRAVALTAEAMNSNPDDLNLKERYIDLILSQQPQQGVEKILDELEARFPTNNAIPLRRARWLAKAGRDDEAEAVYARMLDKNPDLLDLHHLYGRHLLDTKKWKEARKEFEAVLGRNIMHQMAHEGKAMALRGLATQEQEAGRPDLAANYLKWAESHFRSAISWAERQALSAARFHTSIAWFLLAQDRPQEALAAFDKAIRGAPDHFSNYWGKGSALKQLARPAEAIVALKTALAKAPEPLESPAKEEIPRLLEECEKAGGD